MVALRVELATLGVYLDRPCRAKVGRVVEPGVAGAHMALSETVLCMAEVAGFKLVRDANRRPVERPVRGLPRDKYMCLDFDTVIALVLDADGVIAVLGAKAAQIGLSKDDLERPVTRGLGPVHGDLACDDRRALGLLWSACTLETRSKTY